MSGTQNQPTPTFWQDLVGKEFGGVTLPFEEVVFPDVNNTNNIMTIFADTWQMSANVKHADDKYIDGIIDFIKRISEARENAPIYVAAPNIKIWKKLLRVFKKTYPNLFVDYYRSSSTIGVDINKDREVPYRIAIGIGLAEVPVHSFDCLTNSYEESQATRINHVDAATYQAVSRVEDPAGKEPSEVFFYGVRADDVQRLVTWGPGRRVVKSGKNRYGVECAKELSKPHINEVLRIRVNARDRKPEPYIKVVRSASEALKTLNLLNITIREKSENKASDYLEPPGILKHTPNPSQYFGALSIGI